MAIPLIQSALNAGEFSPDLYGRVDLDKYRKATSTLRNFFASYRGGASTRAGTRFCGITLQGNRGGANLVPPPRNIPFQFSTNQGIVIEAGDRYFRFLSDGGYVTEPPGAIVGVTTAHPAVVSFSAPPLFTNGDEVFIQGINGPVGLNGRSFQVFQVTPTSFTLQNTLDGTFISTLGMPAYVGGGIGSRIYTISTPYLGADLPALKFAQSADVMSIVHPNYPPYDLKRISQTNWTLTQTTFKSTIPSPGNIIVSAVDGATSGQQRNFWYLFQSTAVDAVTGEESQPSKPGAVETVDQAVIAGTITLQSFAVPGASSYNFYQGPVSINQPASAGGIYGYLGSSFGTVFTDTNRQPDFSISPPIHNNPFATSPITSVTVTSPGTGYDPVNTVVGIFSPTGDNAVLQPVVVSGQLNWVTVLSGGSGYTGAEVPTITGGTGGTVSFTVGPPNGTYPSTVAYFQQRRFYANTLNNPDTYFASQPGAFTNFDTSLPVKDDDAIIGSPWSQQVNGIEWMINMPGGLVILTGLGAWQLSGGATGIATAAAVTPSNQVANPQAYNGVNGLVPPIVINYDILYVQSRGSIVRNLSYNYFVNIYTGTDMTVLSSHLFDGHTITQWGWAEEPHKLVWAIRDDGILLCMTFLKEQDVYAWSRHDTNGLFQSVCTVSEPPVNAPYFVVKRLIQNNGNQVWVYMQERMDNRLWDHIEDTWCVDCGLAYPFPANTPQATLTFSSATGVATIQQPTIIYGGSGYSSQTFAEIIDATGSGAQITLTVTGGVITKAQLNGTTTGYTAPQVNIIDPLGKGGDAVVQLPIMNLATVSSRTAIFTGAAGGGAAGDVIRWNGGIMTVIQFQSGSQLQVNITRPVPTIPNDPLGSAAPAPPGKWSISTPTSILYGLNHLEGMQVSILADGNVLPPQTVVNGTVTLPSPVSTAVVGLPFTCQLQTLYLDVPGGITFQGRRKELDQIIVRLSKSLTPFEIGANQPDAATQPNSAVAQWQNMSPYSTPYDITTPLQPFELFTGDVYTTPFDGLGATKGQVAIQQTQPTPLTVTAVMPWFRPQDDTDAGA